MGKCQGDCGIPQPSLQSEDMPQKPLDVSTPLFYPRAEEQQASLPGEQPRDANAARIHKSVRVCSHMVHQKAPCCKAGRFSYVDLYWENRHLVSGLPFLVYTSEYSISGLRMCLQNGGSAVSWKSELNPPSWTVFCRLPRRENCDSQGNTMNQRRKLCGVHNFRRWLWWL